jgi:2'-5' RNA ligase
MRCFVAFDVAEPLRKFCHEAPTQLQITYGLYGKSSTAPPHMTVKRPFEISESGLETLIDRLEAAKASHALHRFEGRVNPVAHFNEKILHVPITGTAVEQTMNHLLEMFSGWGFPQCGFEGVRPHVTLVSNIGRENFQLALGLLKEMPLPVQTITFDTLVIRKRPNGSWHEAHRLEL